MTNSQPNASQPHAVNSLATVRGLLAKMKPQLQMALPRHMTADRMIRVATTACQKNPKLLEAHPVTLIGAIVQAAQLGLEPDDGTGKAYLVPFFNSKKNRLEIQFIPGYRGLVDLARRSGQIGAVEARVVHEKDSFRYSFGLEPVLDHQPNTSDDPGPVVYFYAIARFKDGTIQFDVMNKIEVDKIRTRSKAKDSGPWVTDYEEMGKKTVIRRLSKLLPSSVEFHRAVELDVKADAGIPQDLGILVDPTEIGTPEKDAPEPIQEPKPKNNKKSDEIEFGDPPQQ